MDFVARALLGMALLTGWEKTACAEPHLRLGPVSIDLGAQETAIIPDLKKHFTVRAIDGGWEVTSPSQPRVPRVGISTKSGRVASVSFLWGPGITPTLEEMSEQLSYALPLETECFIKNLTHPQEGGTVRTLAFTCGGYAVSLITGVWTRGNTASITIEAK